MAMVAAGFCIAQRDNVLTPLKPSDDARGKSSHAIISGKKKAVEDLEIKLRRDAARHGAGDPAIGHEVSSPCHGKSGAACGERALVHGGRVAFEGVRAGEPSCFERSAAPRRVQSEPFR